MGGLRSDAVGQTLDPAPPRVGGVARGPDRRRSGTLVSDPARHGCSGVQEEEGFSVHVSATRDARYLTITAMSKTSTEVHTMDASDPSAAPALVHRRTAGSAPTPLRRPDPRRRVSCPRCRLIRHRCAQLCGSAPHCAALRRVQPSPRFPFLPSTPARCACRPSRGGPIMQRMHAGLLYWVCHAHGRLVIMHSNPPADHDNDAAASPASAAAAVPESPEYCISVALPPAPPAAGEVPGASTAWLPLITRRPPRAAGANPTNANAVIAVEDMVLFRDHLVLCCRRDGVPTLLTATWGFLGIERNGGGPADAAAPKPQALEDLPQLPLPDWALQVAPGANLQFDAGTFVCHASSPAHPERELVFDLQTRQLRPVAPLSAAALEAVEGIHTERHHVRPQPCGLPEPCGTRTPYPIPSSYHTLSANPCGWIAAVGNSLQRVGLWMI